MSSQEIYDHDEATEWLCRKLKDIIHEVKLRGTKSEGGADWLKMTKNVYPDSSQFSDNQIDYSIRFCEYDPDRAIETKAFAEDVPCGLDLLIDEDQAEVRIGGFNIFEILKQFHFIQDRTGFYILDESDKDNIVYLIGLFEELAKLLNVVPDHWKPEADDET